MKYFDQDRPFGPLTDRQILREISKTTDTIVGQHTTHYKAYARSIRWQLNRELGIRRQKARK